jgi:capsular polysaccharide biosynthesis protein
MPFIPYYHINPPTNCQTLEDITTRFGGSINLRQYDSQVNYLLSKNCSNEIYDFFCQFTSRIFAQEYTGILPNGRVFSAGVVISPDGKTIARDVSVDFGRPLETHFDVHWLLHVKRLKRPNSLPGRLLVAASAGTSSYYHWLFDELPRLLVSDKREIDTLLANTSSQYNRDALNLYGFTGKILQPNGHFRCEELVVPTLVGYTGHPTPKGIELISKFVEPFSKDKFSLGEKIYISREKAEWRRVSNEDELWRQLQIKGFNKVRLEELSWREQISVFRNARSIVAPHGAGLSNLIFCNPGTKVVEFFSRSFMHWCYWQLASLKCLDYHPVVPQGDTRLAHIEADWRLDLKADCHQIMMALLD